MTVPENFYSVLLCQKWNCIKDTYNSPGLTEIIENNKDGKTTRFQQSQEALLFQMKKPPTIKLMACFDLWAHQDLNLGPPDYESGALTN